MVHYDCGLLWHILLISNIIRIDRLWAKNSVVIEVISLSIVLI